MNRLVSASGLSGLSSRDLSRNKRLIHAAEVMIDAAKVHVSSELSGLSSSDFEWRQEPDQVASSCVPDSCEQWGYED